MMRNGFPLTSSLVYNATTSTKEVSMGERVVFNGVPYWRYPESKSRSKRKYFLRPGDSLHRAIWRSVHGEIPDGHHIHHKDGNPNNNDVSNLECISATLRFDEHRNEFMCRTKEEIAENLNKARLKAPEWHKSEEGRAWHRAVRLKYWENPKVTKCKCEICGNEFDSFKATAKFCSGVCSNRSGYLKRKAKKHHLASLDSVGTL